MQHYIIYVSWLPDDRVNDLRYIIHNTEYTALIADWYVMDQDMRLFGSHIYAVYYVAIIGTLTFMTGNRITCQ